MTMWNQELANSQYDEKWAAQCRATYPVINLPDAKGQPTDTYRWFGRLMFPHLYTPTKRENAPGQPTYQALVATLPGYDVSLLRLAADNVAKEEWPRGVPRHWKPAIRPADERAGDQQGALQGAMPGAFLIPVSANSINTKTKAVLKPPSVMTATGQPITDETQIYGGVWGLIVGHAYNFGKQDPTNIGTKFSIEAFIKLFDDNVLGKARVSTSSMLAGVATPVAPVDESQYAHLYQ